MYLEETKELEMRLDSLVEDYGHPDFELPLRLVRKMAARIDEYDQEPVGADGTTAVFLYALLELFPKPQRLAHLLRIVADVSEPYEDGSFR